jgi:hypothetical protein
MIKKSVIIVLCTLSLLGCTAASHDVKDNESGRFKVISNETMSGEYRQVIVDKETGVEYFFQLYSYGGGMTVLVDKDGKPIIYEGD